MFANVAKPIRRVGGRFGLLFDVGVSAARYRGTAEHIWAVGTDLFFILLARTGVKLESAVHCPTAEPQQFQWSGAERHPPPWTDELAEMSRHIYTRHGIGDGLQKPVFQVGNGKPPLSPHISCSTFILVMQIRLHVYQYTVEILLMTNQWIKK